MASTPTLRRLNDRERYWGLSWPEWLAALAAGGVLFAAVRFSPLGFKPTLTITLFILVAAAMGIYGLSGQAISPWGQLTALASYWRHPKQYGPPEGPDRRGLVLSDAPTVEDLHPDDSAGWAELDHVDALEVTR